MDTQNQYKDVIDSKTQHELEKLKTKLKNIEKWLTAEETKAAQHMSANVDYWQARLSLASDLKSNLKNF